MRAARLQEAGAPFEIEDVPTPEPGHGEVLVKIAAAGACHSDLHIRAGEIPGIPESGIMGHENAGWVEALGPGVEGFEPGEPVVVYGGWGCGRCRLCLGGEEQLCDTSRWGGLGPPGGYAEYMVVPAVRHLIRTGELPLPVAAPLTDAALTPYRAVKAAAPTLVGGTSAVVIGAGGLGQMAIQLIRALTPARVVVADISPEKRSTALELGADVAVDPGAAGAVDEIGEATGGGAAVVLDVVGSDDSLALAAQSGAPKSRIVILGLAGGTLPWSFFTWPPEAVLTTSFWGTRNELEEVVALAQAGEIEVRIEEAPLEQINDVFARLEGGEVDGRAVLVP